MIQMETALRQLIAEIVDERIGSAAARGHAMARMYGEYVNIEKADMRLGVKEKHNGSAPILIMKSRHFHCQSPAYRHAFPNY